LLDKVVQVKFVRCSVIPGNLGTELAWLPQYLWVFVDLCSDLWQDIAHLEGDMLCRSCASEVDINYFSIQYSEKPKLL
jgi:hypothetical protein